MEDYNLETKKSQPCKKFLDTFSRDLGYRICHNLEMEDYHLEARKSEPCKKLLDTFSRNLDRNIFDIESAISWKPVSATGSDI